MSEENVKLKQTDRVLQYMRDFGSISAAEAMWDIGVYRLAARISDLKRKGYRITSKMETGNGRYGKVTYKRYFLAEESK